MNHGENDTVLQSHSIVVWDQAALGSSLYLVWEAEEQVPWALKHATHLGGTTFPHSLN